MNWGTNSKWLATHVKDTFTNDMETVTGRDCGGLEGYISCTDPNGK